MSKNSFLVSIFVVTLSENAKGKRVKIRGFIMNPLK